LIDHEPLKEFEQRFKILTVDWGRTELGFQGDGFNCQCHRNVHWRRHSDRWFTVEDRLVVIFVLLVSVQSTHIQNLFFATYCGMGL